MNRLFLESLALLWSVSVLPAPGRKYRQPPVTVSMAQESFQSISNPFQSSYASFPHLLRWLVKESKWFKRAPTMMSPLPKGRGRWALALNTHMVVAAPFLQLHLVDPPSKVTVPIPSKLMHQMTIMMTMKTSLWTLSLSLC
jgi:hypothetical protein